MNKRLLSRQATLEYLEKLKGVPGRAAGFCLPPNLPREETQGVCKLGEIPEDIHPHLIKMAAGSRTGCYVFWSAAEKCLVVPPFPAVEKQVQPLDMELVRSQLQKDLTIALVLIRLGSYAIGVSRGEKLLTSKVGTGLVHGRHRQGGSSSHRFERHRDKQMETFFNRVCEHARYHPAVPEILPLFTEADGAGAAAAAGNSRPAPGSAGKLGPARMVQHGCNVLAPAAYISLNPEGYPR
jgi:hypothetical protein